MSKPRKTPIHPSALPLADALEAHAFTRQEVAVHFKMDVQNVTNWIARGIPGRRITDVAEFCGMTTDEYRFKAGLTKKKPAATAKRSAVDLNDGLPDFLSNYLRRKIAKMRAQYAATPAWLLTKLAPPAGETEYRDWESHIETLMANFAALNDPHAPQPQTPQPQRRGKKVTA